MVHTSSSWVSDGPTTYLLAVGVADFKHLTPEFDLRYAEADASAFSEGLASALGKSLPRNHITVLVGDDATFERVNAALRETLAAADEDDTVILFFSTHGVLSGDEGYLLTWDSTPNERLPYTSLPTKDIVSAVNRSRAAHVLLFTDACHAGITGAGTKGASVPSFDPSKIQVDHRSFFNQASSTIMQPSLEGPQYCGGHGAYTCALLMAMQGAVDRDSDGVVSLRELQIYVPPIVDSLTNGQQSPETKGRFDSQHVFVGVAPNSRDGRGLEEYGVPFEDGSPTHIAVSEVAGDGVIGSAPALLEPEDWTDGGDHLLSELDRPAKATFMRDWSSARSPLPVVDEPLSLSREQQSVLQAKQLVMHQRTKAVLLILATTGTFTVLPAIAQRDLSFLASAPIASLSVFGVLTQSSAIMSSRTCKLTMETMTGTPLMANIDGRCRLGSAAVVAGSAGLGLALLAGGLKYSEGVFVFGKYRVQYIEFLVPAAGVFASSMVLSTGQHLNNARLIPGVSTPGTSSLPPDPTQPMWAQAGWSPMGLTVVGTF